MCSTMSLEHAAHSILLKFSMLGTCLVLVSSFSYGMPGRVLRENVQNKLRGAQVLQASDREGSEMKPELIQFRSLNLKERRCRLIALCDDIERLYYVSAEGAPRTLHATHGPICILSRITQLLCIGVLLYQEREELFGPICYC